MTNHLPSKPNITNPNNAKSFVDYFETRCRFLHNLGEIHIEKNVHKTKNKNLKYGETS